MFPVFLDTNAIFGAALSDLFLTLAERGTYRPLWSAGVLHELNDVLCRNDIDPMAVVHRIDSMRDAFPDAEVFGYECLIPQMQCDKGDRHVLAAAVLGGAAVIVTFNLRHFPAAALDPYQIGVVHPDEFLLDQLDLYPSLVKQTVLDVPEAYENPPVTVREFCDLLARSGVPRFVRAVTRLL